MNEMQINRENNKMNFVYQNSHLASMLFGK